MGLISRVSSRTYRSFSSLKWPNEPRKSESSVNTEPDTVPPSESSSSEWKSPAQAIHQPIHRIRHLETTLRWHLGMQKIWNQDLRRRLRPRNCHRQDRQIRFEEVERCPSHLS